MSNQLDGIKERNDYMYGHRKSELLPILAGDYIGLMSEVERLEKENGYHMRRMKMYEKQAVHLAAENDRLRKALHQLEDIELDAMDAQYWKAHRLDGDHS